MTYFSRNFSAEVTLPDGSVATSTSEVEHFLKANNLASASDYSPEYLRNIRRFQEKYRREAIFAELIQQYKKNPSTILNTYAHEIGYRYLTTTLSSSIKDVLVYSRDLELDPNHIKKKFLLIETLHQKE